MCQFCVCGKKTTEKNEKNNVFLCGINFHAFNSFDKESREKEWCPKPHLAVVSSQVKIDSLRCTPVPPAVTRCERHPNNSSPVPRGEPALLIVPSPTHRLVLLALGHPAFPREAEDVGVAAEDGTMFHGSQHPYWVTRLLGRAEEEAYWSRRIQRDWPYNKTG